jgi:hypothetical protein
LPSSLFATLSSLFLKEHDLSTRVRISQIRIKNERFAMGNQQSHSPVPDDDTLRAQGIDPSLFKDPVEGAEDDDDQITENTAIPEVKVPGLLSMMFNLTLLLLVVLEKEKQFAIE